MRLSLNKTAPVLSCGGGLFFCFLFLAFSACAGPPEVQGSAPPELLPSPQTEKGDVEVEATTAPDIFFSGDPFADPQAEIVAGDHSGQLSQEHLWQGDTPQSRLVELDALPEWKPDEALLERAAALGLARLRARYLANVLSGDAQVLVPEGIRTFGEVLPLRFRVRNPLGDAVELVPTTVGFLLELDWTVERWLPLGSHDRVQRHRFFRLEQAFFLQSDQEFSEYAELPLVVNGSQGAVWLVEVDARLRCAGAVFEERVLPLHEIEFQAARFLVLPPGWEQFQEAPLDNLKRVLAMPSAQVDRHVLVNVALLRGRERQRGVEILLDGLRSAPNDRRVLTITQSLQWLTGVPLGSLPADWLRWEAQRRIPSAR